MTMAHVQRAALENMIKILEGAGTKLANAVKVNIYLAEFDRDFVKMNEIYVQVGFCLDSIRVGDPDGYVAVLWN